MSTKPNVIIPAEPVLFPMWDLIDKHRRDTTSLEVPFRDGYVLIENYNPDFPGLPKELDWKVYLTLQRWVNEKREEIRKFPREITFSFSKLRNALELKRGGGEQIKYLVESLQRLHHTHVSTNVQIDKKKRKIDSFNLLSAVRIESTTGEMTFTVGFPPEFVLKEYYTKDDKPIIAIEGKVLDRISSPTSELIYARLQKHIIASKSKGQFTRTYTYLLEEIFTGYVRRTYQSEIKRQLEKPLNELQKAGIIYDWELYKGVKDKKTGKLKKDHDFRINFIIKPEVHDLVLTQERVRKKKEQEEKEIFEKAWESLSDSERLELKNLAIEKAKKEYRVSDPESRLFKAYANIELKKILKQRNLLS